MVCPGFSIFITSIILGTITNGVKLRSMRSAVWILIGHCCAFDLRHFGKCSNHFSGPTQIYSHNWIWIIQMHGKGGVADLSLYLRHLPRTSIQSVHSYAIWPKLFRITQIEINWSQGSLYKYPLIRQKTPINILTVFCEFFSGCQGSATAGKNICSWSYSRK